MKCTKTKTINFQVHITLNLHIYSNKTIKFLQWRFSNKKKKHTPLSWTTEMKASFDTLKHKLADAPVLNCSTKDRVYILDTDAS